MDHKLDQATINVKTIYAFIINYCVYTMKPTMLIGEVKYTVYLLFDRDCYYHNHHDSHLVRRKSDIEDDSSDETGSEKI